MASGDQNGGDQNGGDQNGWQSALEAARRQRWPGRALDVARLDFDPGDGQPSGARVVLATVTAVVGSLLADAVVVAIGEAVFPSTKGYPHFQFSDYAKLTVIGVLVACAAWPVATRVTSRPREMFFRMAVVVTLVLWLPDLYILAQGQPAKAVALLMLMHLAIALVTYNLLVRVAPCAGRGRSRAGELGTTAPMAQSQSVR
jgi:hypothetical protein